MSFESFQKGGHFELWLKLDITHLRLRLSDDVGNSHINRMGEEGDFCDAMPTYP